MATTVSLQDLSVSPLSPRLRLRRRVVAVVADQQLLSAGFTNVLFDNIPWILDDKTMDGPNSSNSRIEFINETVIELATYQGGEFEVQDWRMSVNQPGAMTSFILWTGEIICPNPQLQGAMTAVTA